MFTRTKKKQRVSVVLVLILISTCRLQTIALRHFSFLSSTSALVRQQTTIQFDGIVHFISVAYLAALLIISHFFFVARVYHRWVLKVDSEFSSCNRTTTATGHLKLQNVTQEFFSAREKCSSELPRLSSQLVIELRFHLFNVSFILCFHISIFFFLFAFISLWVRSMCLIET